MRAPLVSSCRASMLPPRYNTLSTMPLMKRFDPPWKMPMPTAVYKKKESAEKVVASAERCVVTIARMQKKSFKVII